MKIHPYGQTILWLMIRITFFHVFVVLLGVELLHAVPMYAQSLAQPIDLRIRNKPLGQVLQQIERQTSIRFIYTNNLLDGTANVTLEVQQQPVEQVLKTLLSPLVIQYEERDRGYVVLRKLVEQGHDLADPEPEPLPVEISPVQQQLVLTGTVTSSGTNHPLAGASVAVVGTKTATKTDEKGAFSINAAKPEGTLRISFLGYQPFDIKFNMTSTEPFSIALEADVENLNDVVVTGIYQRKKESFSGSSATYTAKELQLVGNQNVLQSLKTLDPAFAIIENNEFGSDPNRLPDIEVRGKSSVIRLTDEYGTNPNQPLFILDGFESTLTVISDISMDRVASITILKDAAATAIYGSKASNGVIVVETKRPAAGQLKINYNLSSSFNFADLSDYNLMNAAEKLQYELLAGFYGAIDANGNIINWEDGETKYYERLQEVRRGVDTYWPNEPLRFGLSQRHTLFAEGGDANLRYGVSLNYGNTQGVMKGSSRDATNGNVRLLYRRGRLSVNNQLSVDFVNANMETVPFSRFSRANPYHRKYNETGGIDKIMESYPYSGLTMDVYNPLYDMSNNNVNRSGSHGITNNFELDWRVVDELRFRTRIGIRRFANRGEVFSSPFNAAFDGVDELLRGAYSESNGNQANYDGELSLTYGKLFSAKHMVNAIGGFRMEQASSLVSAYQVQGFVDDDFANPAFAFGYPEGSSPSYQESMRRSASFFLNTGYAYDERLLMDATVRTDGSSIYGASKQFTTIWSVGLGWNIHNESFFKNSGQQWLNQFKLRGSIGNPGNQNFNDYISMRVYRYNNENRNPFGSSVLMSNLGNSGLEWQKTLDRNLGLDLMVFNNRLRVNFDYFVKNTDPLLVYVSLPSSVGVTSIAQNFGEQLTKGFTAIADYTLLRKSELNWRVNLNMRQLKSKYQNIGNTLYNYNQDNRSRNLIRYYDGASPSDLWAVRSLGIDPPTGREVFLNSNGQQTFVHDYNDEVVVGNSDPDLEGIIGTSFFYKGFSASVNLRYRLGGQIFMQTLYEKVENITSATMALNQDKRALYDRWQEPGDNAKFKAISETDITPISSRFVQDNNILSGESISVGYETLEARWLRALGASSMTVRAYMNDIFHISSVKNERGIDYPFARSVSLSLGVRF